MTLRRFLCRASAYSRAGSRCFVTGSKPDTVNPNWPRVALSFGASVFIWGLLFKQHSSDVHEYRTRNGLE